MNAPLRRLAVVTALLLTSLLVSTTWIQYLAADSIQEGPGNSRALYAQFGRDRGDMFVGDGDRQAAVATSEPVDDEFGFLRSYPQPDLYAHTTGYYSVLLGTSGMERAADEALAGTADELFYRRIQDLVTGRDPTGGIVRLTLDPAVQQAAWDALGDRTGAVVVTEPDTGRVLAMVSRPSYDPNVLASHDLGAVQEAWDALNADPGRPLENRAISGRLYPPGSTFKVVTAAAALEAGRTPETLLPGPEELDLPQTDRVLTNAFDSSCGGGDQVSLADALRVSCNTAFGALGLELGDEALREQAAAFGFGQQYEIPLIVAPSTVPDEIDEPQTAFTAIGQFDVRVTPLQVAMMSAAVANDGVVMRPEVVDSVLAADLSVVARPEPEEVGRAVSPSVAQSLTDMMTLVVESGSGTAAAVPGASVAGKTGTAQTGVEGEDPHAWFTGFAPVEDPQVAVAVVVENGGAGSQVAAPVAGEVLDAALAAAGTGSESGGER
ncbi:MAG: peptidoglycan D,D-transpeptidase FtsI family protein [Kineosporiaceae bacterium]